MQSAKPAGQHSDAVDVKSAVAAAPQRSIKSDEAVAVVEYSRLRTPPLRPRREPIAFPFTNEAAERQQSNLVRIHFVPSKDSDLDLDDILGFTLRFSDKFAGLDGQPILVPVRIVNVDGETEQQVYDAYTLLTRLESDAQSPATGKIITALIVDEVLERERCAHFKERASHLKAMIDACGGVGFGDAKKLTQLIDGISELEREDLSQRLKDKRVDIQFPNYVIPLGNRLGEIHRNLATERKEQAAAPPPEGGVRVDIRGANENPLEDRELDEIEVRYESRCLFYFKKAISLRPVVFVYSTVGIETYHMMIDHLRSARAAEEKAMHMNQSLPHEPAVVYFEEPISGAAMSAFVGALAYIFVNINPRGCFNNIVAINPRRYFNDIADRITRNKGIVAEVITSSVTNGFFQVALENHLFWLQERERSLQLGWDEPTFAEKNVGSPRLISMGVVAGVALVRAGLFYYFKIQAQAQRNNDDRHVQPAVEVRGNRNG